ncbi:MAG: hypothetical protein WB783_20380 [Arenicellales bacterium]
MPLDQDFGTGIPLIHVKGFAFDEYFAVGFCETCGAAVISGRDRRSSFTLTYEEADDV